MIFENSFIFFKKKVHSLYLNSGIYNKKISPSINSSLEYKPSPSLLDCIIKYNKKRIDIKHYFLNDMWDNQKINSKDYKNLNSFFWLFSLDLKSSKKDTQNIILQWIEKNYQYDSKSWEIDIVAKRIIAWLSNSKLTYEDSDDDYKQKFNYIIKKQINHLIYEMKASEWVDDKMIGCAAIILSGLSYQDKNSHLDVGLNFGISYYINENLLIDSKLYTGFMNIGEISRPIDLKEDPTPNPPAYTLKSRAIVFSLAYLF